MECRTLDLTILSARNLKKVRFQKIGAYVTVFISGNHRSAQQTPLDTDGKRNPRWNHRMKFTINEADAQSEDLSLIFRLRYDNRVKIYEVGEVRVLIKDLLNPADPDLVQTVTYSVRLSSGKNKGELHIRYKFSDPFTVEDPTAAVDEVNGSLPTAYLNRDQGSYPPNEDSGAWPPTTTASNPVSRHRKYKSCTYSEGKIGMGLGLGIGFGLIGSLMMGEKMDDVSESMLDIVGNFTKLTSNTENSRSNKL